MYHGPHGLETFVVYLLVTTSCLCPVRECVGSMLVSKFTWRSWLAIQIRVCVDICKVKYERMHVLKRYYKYTIPVTSCLEENCIPLDGTNHKIYPCRLIDVIKA